MRYGWLLAIAAVAGPVRATQAHQTWANGQPVPAWVVKACCGPSEAHHLSPQQVHRVDKGYRIEGYPGLIADAQVLPSEDGEFWAFYIEGQEVGGNKLFSSVFCFFAPTGS